MVANVQDVAAEFALRALHVEFQTLENRIIGPTGTHGSFSCLGRSSLILQGPNHACLAFFRPVVSLMGQSEAHISVLGGSYVLISLQCEHLYWWSMGDQQMGFTRS